MLCTISAATSVCPLVTGKHCQSDRRAVPSLLGSLHPLQLQGGKRFWVRAQALFTGSTIQLSNCPSQKLLDQQTQKENSPNPMVQLGWVGFPKPQAKLGYTTKADVVGYDRWRFSLWRKKHVFQFVPTKPKFSLHLSLLQQKVGL